MLAPASRKGGAVLSRELFGLDWWFSPDTLDHYRPSHIRRGPFGGFRHYSIHNFGKCATHHSGGFVIWPLESVRVLGNWQAANADLLILVW